MQAVKSTASRIRSPLMDEREPGWVNYTVYILEHNADQEKGRFASNMNDPFAESTSNCDGIR